MRHRHLVIHTISLLLAGMALPSALQAAPAEPTLGVSAKDLSPVATKQALLMLLAAYHRDPSAQALDAWRPGLAATLESIAQDRSLQRLQRIRALSCLAREGGEAAFALLARTIRSREEQPRLKIAAVRALSNHLGAPALDAFRVEHLLAEALADPDPGVRKIAVLGLDTIDTPGARLELAQRRLVERHAAVRAVLRQALRHQQANKALPPEGVLVPKTGSNGREVK